MATLDVLITQKSAEQWQEEILADLQDTSVTGGVVFPVTAWQPGNVARTFTAVQANVAEDLGLNQLNIARGGFLSTATDDWLTLKADEDYDVQRDDPVATIGIAVLTDSGGGGPFVYAANDLVAKDASGREFRNLTGGTLPLSGELYLEWQAVEAAAEYNISNNTLTVLVTGSSGVTVNNPATWLTTPGTPSSRAAGFVELTDGAGTGPHVIGVGTVTVSDGVQTYTNTTSVTIENAATASVAVEATANGVAYNVDNNTITTVAVTPVAGLTVDNPGSTWITTSGSDQQSDPSVREECSDRWSTGGVGWTEEAIRFIAKQSPTTTPVTRVAVETNPGGVPGLVGVTVASVAGAMSVADVATVQAYFDADRITLTSSLTVASASVLTITVSGTVRVPAALAGTSQSDGERNLNALEASTPIGGQSESGNTLPLEALITAIANAQYDDNGNQTNPAAPYDIDLTSPTIDTPLAADEVPDIDYSGLVWVPV